MNELSMVASTLENPKMATLLIAITIWSLIWKGLALWKSAQSSQKQWFVAMLILNTGGLLEIFYLFVISRKKKDIVNDNTPEQAS